MWNIKNTQPQDHLKCPNEISSSQRLGTFLSLSWLCHPHNLENYLNFAKISLIWEKNPLIQNFNLYFSFLSTFLATK